MLVVVDRMTKQVHITPCNDFSARGTAYMFFRDCFRLHGLPDTITSNCGSQFTSEIWKWTCKFLQIDHRLSTSFHPQTDGQTERVNARIKLHLRAYINFVQNDWVRLLPSVEFALNNNDTQITGTSPFPAVYGMHPRSGSELSAPFSSPPAPASIKIERKDAKILVSNMQKVEKFLIENIELHITQYEDQANRKRTAARNYQPGDSVWLNYKNVRLLRPCQKLDFKNGGPFKIIDPVGKYAFGLKLPSTSIVHPVFYVSLFSPVAHDLLPSQTSGPPPTLNAADPYPEYEIEKIIGSQWVNNKLHYLV